MFLQKVGKQILCKNRSLSFFRPLPSPTSGTAAPLARIPLGSRLHTREQEGFTTPFACEPGRRTRAGMAPRVAFSARTHRVAAGPGAGGGGGGAPGLRAGGAGDAGQLLPRPRPQARSGGGGRGGGGGVPAAPGPPRAASFPRAAPAPSPHPGPLPHPPRPAFPGRNMAGSSEEAPDYGRGIVVNANSRAISDRAVRGAPRALSPLPRRPPRRPRRGADARRASGARGPVPALFPAARGDRVPPPAQPSPPRCPRLT